MYLLIVKIDKTISMVQSVYSAYPAVITFFGSSPFWAFRNRKKAQGIQFRLATKIVQKFHGAAEALLTHTQPEI